MFPCNQVDWRRRAPSSSHYIFFVNIKKEQDGTVEYGWKDQFIEREADHGSLREFVQIYAQMNDE
jgi:hypothetical protein